VTLRNFIIKRIIFEWPVQRDPGYQFL